MPRCLFLICAAALAGCAADDGLSTNEKIAAGLSRKETNIADITTPDGITYYCAQGSSINVSARLNALNNLLVVEVRDQPGRYIFTQTSSARQEDNHLDAAGFAGKSLILAGNRNGLIDSTDNYKPSFFAKVIKPSELSAAILATAEICRSILPTANKDYKDDKLSMLNGFAEQTFEDAFNMLDFQRYYEHNWPKSQAASPLEIRTGFPTSGRIRKFVAESTP
jgi:hypothetical protein